MSEPPKLPQSTQALPADVQAELTALQERLHKIRWLDGPRDESRCSELLRDYFDRIKQIGTESRRGYWTGEHDPTRMRQLREQQGYQDCGTFGIKWIKGDWSEAIGWTRHCYEKQCRA